MAATRESVGGGFVRPPILAILVGSTVLGVAVAVLESGASHSAVSPAVAAPIYALSAVAIVAVFVLSSYYTFVRRVEMSDEHVRFFVGSQLIRVRWADLLPPKSPYFLGITFHYVPREGNPPDPGLALTREQARAILSNPHCPRFELDSKIWESVGLRDPHHRSVP